MDTVNIGISAKGRAAVRCKRENVAHFWCGDLVEGDACPQCRQGTAHNALLPTFAADDGRVGLTCVSCGGNWRENCGRVDPPECGMG